MTKKRFAALVLGLSGIAVLVFFIFPIAAYELAVYRKFPQLKSPATTSYLDSISGLPDYTKADTWFSATYSQSAQKVEYYQLSIPKLGIANASVEIGGDDLGKHLIQYPGTALPGRVGNAVIFGHSVLPAFFNPKNYLTIFSTLPTLTLGDEIIVDYDGLTYKYSVEQMFEVRPTDIEILEQDTSGVFLTLVTCTPPGHPLRPKRLIVRARVVNPHQANTL